MSLHPEGSTLSRDIWDRKYWGSHGVLSQQKAEFKKFHGLEESIAWMSILDSALASVLPRARRLNPLALLHAFWCVRQLKPRVVWLWDLIPTRVFRELSAEQCQVVSDIVLRWSSVPLYGGDTWLDCADKYADTALSRGSTVSHTKPLAYMTLAYIHLKKDPERGLGVAKECLRKVQTPVLAITDNNQRARVYREMAELTVIVEEWTEGAKNKARDLLNQADLSAQSDDIRTKNDAMRRKLKL